MHPAQSCLPGLTNEESFILKWQYKLLGDYGTAFMSAAIKADDENLDRLAKGFPIEIGALRRYWHEKGWWDSVENKARELELL